MAQEIIPSEIDHDTIQHHRKFELRFKDQQYEAIAYKIRRLDEPAVHADYGTMIGTFKLKWVQNGTPNNARFHMVIRDGTQCVIGYAAIRYVENTAAEYEYLSGRSSNVRINAPTIPHEVCILKYQVLFVEYELQ